MSCAARSRSSHHRTRPEVIGGATSGLAGVIGVQVTAPTSAGALNLNNAYDDAMQVALANIATSA